MLILQFYRKLLVIHQLWMYDISVLCLLPDDILVYVIYLYILLHTTSCKLESKCLDSPKYNGLQ